MLEVQGDFTFPDGEDPQVSSCTKKGEDVKAQTTVRLEASKCETTINVHRYVLTKGEPRINWSVVAFEGINVGKGLKNITNPSIQDIRTWAGESKNKAIRVAFKECK